MAKDVKVFVATFSTQGEADEALRALRALEREGSTDLIDTAVLVRGEDGKVTVTETGDGATRRWMRRGALAGGLVGLVFPPSILVSAALGAGGGGLWGKLRDTGFDDAQLRRVGESLPVGGSAIVAIVEDTALEQVQQTLTASQHLASTTLSAAAVAVLETSDDERD